VGDRLDEDRDLTSLLPLHGSSSRDIGNPTAREFAAKRLDAHPFEFHPEARRRIVYSDDSTTMLVDDVRIAAYGRGRLEIMRYELMAPEKGDPRFRWIEFNACLSFPR
jgi:hypothetical protein